jgi:amino acid transporter
LHTVNLAETQAAPDRLSRQLGVVSLTSLLVGVTIGSGIFRVPSIVAAQLPSVGGAAIVWLAGAVITLAGALPLVALTATFPRSGGAYVHLREGYGPVIAFLFGWVKLLVTGPSALAALALIFGEYARAFAPLTDRQVQLVAGLLLVLLTAANIRSVKWSAALQNASTLAKVLALVALTLLLFGLGDPTRGAFAQSIDWAGGGMTARGFWTALIVVLWTYTGWVDFTYVAGEVRDPVRTFPRALTVGMVVILLVYLGINAAYLYVLPIPEIAKSSLVAATAVHGPLGSRGALFVALLVMVSTLGSLNGSILTSPRVFFAMAEDDLFFRSVAKVHPRDRTPHVALGLYLLLGLAGVATRTFEQLAALFVLGAWPFYALAVGAVFTLPRRRPDLAMHYHKPVYLALAVVFLVVSAAMLISATFAHPLEMAISVGILALGVPVYYAWRAVGGRRPSAQGVAAEAADQ